MIERETVIIGERIELIVGKAQKFLSERKRIVAFLREGIPLLICVVFHKTIIEHNVMTDEKTTVAELIKIGNDPTDRRSADQHFVVDPGEFHDIER